MVQDVAQVSSAWRRVDVALTHPSIVDDPQLDLFPRLGSERQHAGVETARLLGQLPDHSVGGAPKWALNARENWLTDENPHA